MEAIADTTQNQDFLEQRRRRGVSLTVAAIVVFISLVMIGFTNKILSPRVLTPVELKINGARLFDTPRALTPFELQNQRGEAFSLESLKGQWSLVFFGFTHCPDICPSTLALLNSWYQTLDTDIQASTQVVLVSADPARDTPEVLAPYMDYFNPQFVGVSGEFLATKRLANQLNIAFAKVTQGDDYTIDHSGHIALINPRGDYHAFFKPPFDPARLKLTYLSMRTSF